MINNIHREKMTTYKVIKFVIILGQCFSLLPINGVNSGNVSDLKFTWFSMKTFYNFFLLSSTSFVTAMSLQRLYRLGIKFVYIGKVEKMILLQK